MKEIVLRIIQSTKEPIQGVTRRKGQCIFHCAIDDTETLLQEEVNCGQVVSLRVRQLCNPPPEMIHRESYKSVTKLELSCPVEVSWVFSVTSILPGLNIVRFGSSCFEYPFGDCSPLSQTWLTKCPSVKELLISFDHRKLLQEDYDKNVVIKCLNAILEYSTKYFTNLCRADLNLPFGVNLEHFLTNNPTLAGTGEKKTHSHHGTIQFQSFFYTEKRTNSSIPRRDSGSSGSGSEPSLTIVGQTISLHDPRVRLPPKRGSSTELSSDFDEDSDDLGRSSKNFYRPTSRIIKKTDSDSLHELHDLASSPPVIDYTPAYNNRSGSLENDRNPLRVDNLISTNSSPPRPVIEGNYTDFSQMYTRRR